VVRAWGSMTDGGPCIRYGVKKIKNFFFVSYGLKRILNMFWTCSDDFYFSRSANPLHDSMYKVWGKKNRKFFFCFLCNINGFYGVWTWFDYFCFSRLLNSLHSYGLARRKSPSIAD